MRSISLRCASLKDSLARERQTGPAGPQTARQHMGAHQISSSFVLLSSGAQGALRGLEAGEVVGLDPARRADGKAGLGAGGNLARGLEVAADERRLRGGELGAGGAVLLAIGHRELHEAFG